MVMKFEGQVKLENKKLVFDAEPQVMSRVRKLFDNAKNMFEPGKYTHKPIMFPITLSACRDLIWLMERYLLEVDSETLSLVTSKSNEYEEVRKKVSTADQNSTFLISPNAFVPAIPLRDHQIKFRNMFSDVKRMLLADRLGLGKTYSALSVILEPEARPALIVVPTNLCTQWECEVKRLLPQASTHVIRGFKNYDLPKVDVLITSYNRLAPWQDVLLDKSFEINTIIFDEAHELRHSGSGKWNMANLLSRKAKYCAGLSGTPIFNMGAEIWSVMEVLNPGALGTEDEFSSEWCTWGKVNEPSTLHNFLKTQGLMLRRSPEDIGLKFGEASRHVFTIDSDLEKLKEVQNVAKMLALSVLSGNIGEDSESARKFDWQLRQATGIAKAKPVAEFVKMLVEQGEKVVLAGWHRAVYEVWNEELAKYNPVMYTGSETTKQKDNAVKSFVEGDAQIFIISLRSGAGLDGLQKACSTVVIGEMDWTNAVHDQVIGRLDRDGQTKPVQAYFLTIADGSDPFIVQTLGIKRSQSDGIIDGKSGEGLLVGSGSGNSRIRDMAKSYLTSIGEEIPEPIPETGLLGDVSALIRRAKLPTNTEEEMQEALHKILRENLSSDVFVEREFKITKRSRLDFLVSQNEEKIAIECKIDSTDRQSVYRQVRRYVEEGNISALVLIAPWHGIASFKIDGTPVIVIDTNINSI